MKNVLIVSYFFPPLNSSGSRRFGLMTPYMEEFGWRPWVITTKTSDTEPIKIPESQIFRIGSKESVSSGINLKTEEQIKYILLKDLFIQAKKIKKKVEFRAFELGWRRWYSEVLANKGGIKQRLPQIDLVLASYSPSVTLWLGRYFSNKYGVPWIADYRDLGALRHGTRNKIACYIDGKIERFLMRNVKGVTTVSHVLKEILYQTYTKPSAVIYNGWDRPSLLNNRSECEVSQVDLKEFGESKYVYYAGRLYLHRLDSIFLLLEVLKFKGDLKLFLRSLGPVELEKKVLSKVRALGIENQIQIYPPCDHAQVYFESQRALANLVFEDLNPNNRWARGTLTGKLFEFLSVQPPVLAIAMHNSEIGRILKETQKGELCSSKEEIDSFLDKIEKNGYGEIENEEYVDMYSRKYQTEKLCNFFDKILQGNLSH